MIKPEQLKQVETTRESIVRGMVYATVDSIVLEEAQSYNGVDHEVRIPYSWGGFSAYDSYDIENTLAILEYDIELIWWLFLLRGWNVYSSIQGGIDGLRRTKRTS